MPTTTLQGHLRITVVSVNCDAPGPPIVRLRLSMLDRHTGADSEILHEWPEKLLWRGDDLTLGPVTVEAETG